MNLIAKGMVVVAAFVCGAVSSPSQSQSQSQGYPNRPVRMVVPFAPGGSNDVLARVLSKGLSDRLGQPFVVENKTGAGGNIGGAYVANSPADGYTLLMVHNGLTMLPWTQKNLGYDPLKMEPILIGVRLPMVITVSPDLPVYSVKDLIAYAKANPGKLSYATPGIGTPHHLAGEYFKKLTGIDMVAIPYRGTAEIVSDLRSGRVNVLFSAIDTMRPHIASGAIRAIAVADEKKIPDFPNLPTTSDVLPGFEIPFWLGVMAPAGTPKPIVELLAREMAAVLEAPETKARLAATGMIVDVAALGKMRAIIDSDYERWGAVVKSAGLEVN